MSSENYSVLARKYRPADFSSLIGQETLVRTLTNSMKSGKIAHAFLLTGIRGVGKTTTARIIAKALNCTASPGPTPEPCGKCESCVSIARDKNVDVMEMDAASRTGVGDIRELLETCKYMPLSARYKVYIIDEVHMLSNSAFNALLKTLEEPPAHVKFIFATTESRKIPATIVSRCQRFDLRRVDTEALVSHLRRVAEEEGVKIEEAALDSIAAAGEGSVRDSLSIMDQAIAYSGAYGDKTVTEAEIRDMLGLADRSACLALFKTLMSGEMAESLAAYGSMCRAGAAPEQVLEDLLEICHLVTRLKITPDLKDRSVPAREMEEAGMMASGLSVASLSQAWQILLKGLAETKTAPSPKTAGEMALVRLGFASGLPDPGELVRKILETPAASPAPAKAPPAGMPLFQPASFLEAVELFRERGELLLHGHLVNDVRLISFKPPNLNISILPAAPASLPSQVAGLLGEWTGKRWMVAVSADGGEPTIARQEEERQEKALNDAARHPLVKGILSVFPGARLRRIYEKTNYKEAV